MDASQIERIKKRLEDTRRERLLLAERAHEYTIDVHKIIESSRQIMREHSLELRKIQAAQFSD